MRRFADNDIISLVSGAPPLYDLSESFGPHARLRDVVGDDVADLAELELAYGSAQGDARVRERVAGLYGVGAEEVVLTNGGIQALFLLAYVTCGPGDEAIIGSPVFPMARNALESVGATVHAVPAHFDERYRVAPDAVRARLTARTKLVSLATPQNPSGIAVPLATLRALADSMAQVCPAACLVVDETYRDAVYGNDPRATSAVDVAPNIVSIASLSKCHGAPGLRIGWAVVRDAALREQIITGKFNTTISCSPLDEAIALRVLARHEEIIGRARHALSDNLTVTENWVRAESERIEWVRPDAGALCCVRLRGARYDAGGIARFHRELASQGVRVARGEWFGDEAGVFRLGFGFPKRADLEAALDCVSAALRAAEAAVA
jgi:aspartate/methionine/tyrosine aminotransferase